MKDRYFYSRIGHNLLSFSQLFLIFSCLSSCSLFFGPTEQGEKSAKLTFQRTPAGWVEHDPDKSDFAFFHPDKKSMIVVNSLCKKYDSSSLKHLNFNLLGGIEDIEIVEQEKMTFHQRDSLRTKLRGKLDGVPIWLLTQTLKKDFCVYDFVLIAPTFQSYEMSESDFYSLLEEVRLP